MASKFQKADSTNLLVGISVNLKAHERSVKVDVWRFFIEEPYPMSKKICLNSSRTLSKGCRAPPSVGSPRAAKLYFLN